MVGRGKLQGLHELTQEMDTEWLSFIPHLGFRTLNHGQVEWGIWFHHVRWSSCQKSLENIHGTSICTCRVDAWAEIPLCAKFFPTGSRLGSSLRFPYDVLSPFAAFLLSYLKVSEENFAMLVTRTPAEMHRVVQPNCTEKSFRRMVSKLLLAPKLFKLIVCYLTALVAFVLTPMPRGKFQRSYLE